MKLEQIDTSTTAGKAEVMRLAAEGRNVATTNLSGEWQKCSLPEWAWDSYDYAIIAEPVGPEEVWVVVGDDGLPCFAKPSGADGYAHEMGGTVVRYVRADQ